MPVVVEVRPLLQRTNQAQELGNGYLYRIVSERFRA